MLAKKQTLATLLVVKTFSKKRSLGKVNRIGKLKPTHGSDVLREDMEIVSTCFY